MAKFSKSMQAKKDRRLLVRPKFDENLLPQGLSILFNYANSGGARKIIIAEVYEVNSGVTFTRGHAICAPMDTYNQERGCAIALGRAVKIWWDLTGGQSRPPIVLQALAE